MRVFGRPAISREPDVISNVRDVPQTEAAIGSPEAARGTTLEDIQEKWIPAFLRHAKEQSSLSLANETETVERSKLADLWSVMIIALGVIFTLAWIWLLSALLLWVVMPFI
jgi:hypothetical protein